MHIITLNMAAFTSSIRHYFYVFLILIVLYGTKGTIQSDDAEDVTMLPLSVSKTKHALSEETPLSSASLCLNGIGFKSLADCHELCNFHGMAKSVHKVNAKLRTSYKLLILKSNEYKIQDGNLMASRPSIETLNFIERNDSALICYKLPASFTERMHRCVSRDNFALTENDTRIYVKDYKQWYPFDQFYLINEPNLCVGAAICISEITIIFQKLEDIHLILDSLSAAFLWFTSALCFFLPGMGIRRNRSLLYHLSMLTIGYTVISWKSAIMMYFPDSLTDSCCIFLSSLQQFTLLSAFFWMNIQSYELYSSLRQPLWPDILEWLDKKRWLFHCLCGWCLPLVLTLLTLEAEINPSFPDYLRPGFAQECWFNFNKKAMIFLWYYGWMAISLLINLILFVFITKSLRKWSKDVSIVNGGSVMQTSIVSGKLIFIMGFCWLLNLFRWSLVTRGYVWYVLDMIRALQGFYIFLAYVCRPRVWHSIRRKCKKEKKVKTEQDNNAL